MRKEEEKVDFDLSVLTLQELLDVYNNITEFIQFVEDKKIVEVEKVTDDDK